MTLRVLATIVGRGIMTFQILFSETPERPLFLLVAQVVLSAHREEGDVRGFLSFSFKKIQPKDTPLSWL